MMLRLIVEERRFAALRMTEGHRQNHGKIDQTQNNETLKEKQSTLEEAAIKCLTA